jgi:plasmid maintenance system killer protein
MRLAFTPHFQRSYRKAPSEVQQMFNKMSLLLLGDLGHPSLHAKKYDESRGLWQARVNRDWRFYFTIEDDEYRMQEIKPHPK